MNEDNADPRPWEEPGEFRRDFDPSAGSLSLLLGVFSCICALLGFLFPVLALGGLLISIAAGWAASQDRELLRFGLVHPEERDWVERGIDSTEVALRVNLGVLGYWVVFLLFLLMS